MTLRRYPTLLTAPPQPARPSTFRCGLCNVDKLVHSGRWKHRIMGWCCHACVPKGRAA